MNDSVLKSFVTLTRLVDVSDQCENWVSTSGPKRITLDSCDKIKLNSYMNNVLRYIFTQSKLLV